MRKRYTDKPSSSPTSPKLITDLPASTLLIFILASYFTMIREWVFFDYASIYFLDYIKVIRKTPHFNHSTGYLEFYMQIVGLFWGVFFVLFCVGWLVWGFLTKPRGKKENSFPCSAMVTLSVKLRKM